jgi:hypothetical protein
VNRIADQAGRVLDFYRKLDIGGGLPESVTILNPYVDKEGWKLTETFYQKYYGDHEPRIFLFGINPGRFGGGVTGIPFTDPVRLQEACGIPNELKKKPELSSEFIYRVIAAYGGPSTFYKNFLVTALSPLGFVRDGKNLNYYDDRILLRRIEPFILRCLQIQKKSIPARDVVFCLGEGENFRYFRKLNEQHHFFSEIIPLPHPRWVMQYRRKKISDYTDLYLRKLSSVRDRFMA